MGYADQRYYTLKEIPAAFAASFGTATASSATGHDLTDVASLPKFIKRTAVKNIRMRVTTIPDAGSTNLKAHFLNGTDTFGVVTLTTATADQFLDVTMTASNGTFAADGQPTVKTTGTATASADAQGAYDIWFEVQELPA